MWWGEIVKILTYSDARRVIYSFSINIEKFDDLSCDDAYIGILRRGG